MSRLSSIAIGFSGAAWDRLPMVGLRLLSAGRGHGCRGWAGVAVHRYRDARRGGAGAVGARGVRVC